MKYVQPFCGDGRLLLAGSIRGAGCDVRKRGTRLGGSWAGRCCSRRGSCERIGPAVRKEVRRTRGAGPGRVGCCSGSRNGLSARSLSICGSAWFGGSGRIGSGRRVRFGRGWLGGGVYWFLWRRRRRSFRLRDGSGGHSRSRGLRLRKHPEASKKGRTKEQDLITQIRVTYRKSHELEPLSGCVEEWMSRIKPESPIWTSSGGIIRRW